MTEPGFAKSDHAHPDGWDLSFLSADATVTRAGGQMWVDGHGGAGWGGRSAVARDPSADLAGPHGLWDFFDLGAFLAAFNAGCP